MRLTEFNYRGQATIKEDIDFSLSKEEQIWSLNQNVMHVTYDSDLLLDVGWTNEFETEGFFQVNIIKGGDWDDPILLENVRFDDLPGRLVELIGFIESYGADLK
ncbi:MAG: hypothetical protein Roseis2KO_35970 [Roseivirga sp.]